MRAALLHRVSTVDQDAKLARDELRAAARAHRARVVLDVEETGSGASNDRPKQRLVMEAARKGKLDVVMVWKLDRWGRSALDIQLTITELVETYGVRFICVSQGLDIKPGRDAVSGLLLRMLAAFAEFERDLISSRTRLGLARARKRGAQLGRPKVPRPDVEAVRQVMCAREKKYPRARLPEVAKLLRCTLHALKEVLPEATCAERRHSWTRNGEHCRRGGERCKRRCGAVVCSWHTDKHTCAAAPKGKGRVFRAASSARARSRLRGKRGSVSGLRASSRRPAPAARLKNHPFSTPTPASRTS
mgnify:CR=1 FL=1